MGVQQTISPWLNYLKHLFSNVSQTKEEIGRGRGGRGKYTKILSSAPMDVSGR